MNISSVYGQNYARSVGFARKMRLLLIKKIIFSKEFTFHLNAIINENY
jgi:hypothetical protein